MRFISLGLKYGELRGREGKTPSGIPARSLSTARQGCWAHHQKNFPMNKSPICSCDKVKTPSCKGGYCPQLPFHKVKTSKKSPVRQHRGYEMPFGPRAQVFQRQQSSGLDEKLTTGADSSLSQDCLRKFRPFCGQSYFR